jgi:uncharacterized protein YecT (DUF1311 family)
LRSPSHAFAKIENGNPASPDGRFRVDYVGEGTFLNILDSRGKAIFAFENGTGKYGDGVYGAADSQRLVVVVQYKWYAAIEAAKLEDGRWKSIPVADFSHELNDKAQLYLGIQIQGGAWSDYGNYFEDLKWLNNYKFQFFETQNYGNGKGPKDLHSDSKELHFFATMEFESDSVRTDDITVTGAPAQSEASSTNSKSVDTGKIENDPRYASSDLRLNQVYAALRSRLSPARREQLRLSEREFLRRRDQLRNNREAFFALTEQQISILQQMLDALR